jgi:hypothetical protein
VTDTTERNKKQDKVSTLDKEYHTNVTKYKWQIQQKGTISYSTQIIENCKILDVVWPKLLLHNATLTLMNAYLSHSHGLVQALQYICGGVKLGLWGINKTKIVTLHWAYYCCI